MFRFTGSLLDPRKGHPELLQVVAPLLIPPKYHSEATQYSNPLMIVDIAKEVVRLQHLATTTIMNMACHNTLQFFHLIH